MADEPSEIKRIPPHSTEAERAVLGAMIMDPDAIASASEILTGADFYQRQYGIIFDAIRELFNENSAVDIVTLRERLGMKNLPAEYSSVDFLTSLADSVPTSANVTYYAKLVKERGLNGFAASAPVTDAPANEQKTAAVILQIGDDIYKGTLTKA